MPSDRGTPVSTSLREGGGSQVPWQGPRGDQKVASNRSSPCVKESAVWREKGRICSSLDTYCVHRCLLCAQTPTVCTDAYCVHGCLHPWVHGHDGSISPWLK